MYGAYDREKWKLIRKAVKDKFAWPGGYTILFFMEDCAYLCNKCVRENWRQIIAASKNPGDDRQWEVMAIVINWEDPGIRCAHCGEALEPEYGDGKIPAEVVDGVLRCSDCISNPSNCPPKCPFEDKPLTIATEAPNPVKTPEPPLLGYISRAYLMGYLRGRAATATSEDMKRVIGDVMEVILTASPGQLVEEEKY